MAAPDLAAVHWLDEGTRTGLAAAVAAGVERALTLAAVDDSGALPIGVVAVDLPSRHGRTLPWLWLLEVRPGRRGRGIGSALLDAAHRQLTAQGFAAVELSVDDENVRAAALYARMGYVAVGSGIDQGAAGPVPWTRMRWTPRDDRGARGAARAARGPACRPGLP